MNQRHNVITTAKEIFKIKSENLHTQYNKHLNINFLFIQYYSEREVQFRT